jgi:hypothetical protein
LGLAPIVEVFGDHVHSFSVRKTLFLYNITLPIFLLEGYLTGGWIWKDLEKKFPE